MKSTCLAKKIGAIIPAAGQGQRMGGQGNKLLLELAGTPILLFALQTFQRCSYIHEIVIPAASNEIEIVKKMVKENDLHKVSAIIPGGKQRQDSVYNGLRALGSEVEKVVVHDGARPLLTLKELGRFIEDTMDVEAAIMTVGLKDTVKRIDDQGWVVETPPRERLCLVQTPQIFDRTLLEQAHQSASLQSYETTDDAALMEWQGYRVKVMDGSYENIKVTTPEDLLLAQAILQTRKGE